MGFFFFLSFVATDLAVSRTHDRLEYSPNKYCLALDTLVEKVWCKMNINILKEISGPYLILRNHSVLKRKT